jgi:hypothetical protein
MIGSDTAFLHSALQTVMRWVEANWREGDIIDQRVEMIT